MSGIDNPYWDLVKDRVVVGASLWGTPSVDGLRRDGSRGRIEDWIEASNRHYREGTDRHSLTKRYSWTIPDPETLAFVVEHSRGRIVDPMAGTGYWGWLFAQSGVDAACSDLEPGTNTYHDGQPLHCTVTALDGVDAVRLHGDRTLFLSWPPMDSCGADILRAYPGDRVIYIGEPEGGCTGDDDLYELLNKEWTEVAERVPVQWDGLHDVVWVYDRAGGAR